MAHVILLWYTCFCNGGVSRVVLLTGLGALNDGQWEVQTQPYKSDPSKKMYKYTHQRHTASLREYMCRSVPLLVTSLQRMQVGVLAHDCQRQTGLSAN